MRRILSVLVMAFLALTVSLGAAGTARAADGTVKMTTLEWPPYVGADLSGLGASTAVVKAAFAAMGHSLEVEVLPWNRAVQTAKDGQGGVVAYYPEYYSADLEGDFIFSDPIGSGPLGFVENADNPVPWSSLDDLEGMTIGVVDGYVNTAEFDARVASGAIQGEAVASDLINLRKVARGRIPMAVIDQNVMNHIAATDESVDPATIRFNDRLLEDKSLHVAFRRSPEGEAMAEILNEGLKKIDVDAIMAETMAAN